MERGGTTLNYNVRDFGAHGDGLHDDAAPIQAAIDYASDHGGGRIVLPSGYIFYSGSLTLRSAIDFHVAVGARLQASREYDHYHSVATNQDGDGSRAFLWAKNARHLTISGGGIVDGGADPTDREGEGDRVPVKPRENRPTLIYLEGCEDLTIRDLTIQNALFWTIHPAACVNVLIDGIRIVNRLDLPNTDGIDPDHCRNVRIVNCNIETGDDGICLKNTRRLPNAGPTEQVIISGCVITSTSAGIKIGTESVDDFRNIMINSCVITRSNRGICLQLRDEGTIEQVIVDNVLIETGHFHPSWWGRAEPISITGRRRTANGSLGRIRNIYFSNIRCRSENGIFLEGMPDQYLDGVHLSRLTLIMSQAGNDSGGSYDRRPGWGGEDVLHSSLAGVHAQFVRHLTVSDLDVQWDPRSLPGGSEFWLDHVEGLPEGGGSTATFAPTR